MLPTQEESRAWLSRCLRRVPVYFACMLLGGPWALFTFYVAIDRVLLTRHAVVRFIWQMVVFNGLLILAGAAFIAACARPAIKPDPSFAPPDARPLRPDDDRPAHYPGGGHRRARSGGAAAEGYDDDDIPLRVLRDSPRTRTPASSLPSSSATPVIPVGEVPSRAAPEDAYDDAPEADEEDHALLPKDDDEEQVEAHEPLTAKSGTGGPRWCRKCDAWKPDRTHHCRSCRQCVLKMDHHCPWINNCVGYHNYKYFVLFTTYTALFALFGAWNSGYEVYRYFVDPPDITPGRHSEAEFDEWEEIHVAFKPVVLMLLVFMGTTMGLALAGLSGYHWYLLLNNRTTLEDLNRLPPAALLDPETRATVEALGHRGTRRQQPGAWRPEYILTRGERERLREEARNINVYDVGWSNNVRAVMVGETVPAPQTWVAKTWYGVRALNPMAPPRQKRHGAGHFFPHNPASLAQLRSLTRELRVGQHEPPTASRDAGAYAGGGQWTLGDDSSDSMSDSSDSDRTLYGEAYGERRRGQYDA